MRGQAGEWWQTRWFATVATLIACAPLAWPDFPPLTDLLGHAGRYRVMLDGGAGPLGQWYGFQWRPVGNLGADMLVALLGPAIGLEAAVRIAVALAVALTTIGLLTLSRAAHGQVSPYALVALPLVWNHALHTGFLNFALAMGLALNALALWLFMAGNRWRPAVFVPIALIVWSAHAFGWAVLALAGFAADWARTRRPFAAALACLPLAAPLPLMLLWRSASGGETFGFLDIEAKLLAVLMILRDRWAALDIASLIVTLAVLVYGIRKGRLSGPIGWAAAALFAAFLALPTWLMGSAFADMRAAPFVLALALVALAPADPRQARTVAMLGLALLVSRTGATAASLVLAGERQDRELAALAHVPEGARIALFVSPECAEPWRMARLDHIGGLATARRRAFVNDQWPDIGASLLTVRYPAAHPFEADPSQLLPCDGGAALTRRLAMLPRDAFDYLWLVNLPDRPAPRPGQVWGAGNSALYRLD
ncbi:hypothetical protein [Sphingomonas sp.]|uniref:hypothetical protein n=1 Tax=Sphingomonas sp. TaxID=28214 RepID=UPI002DD686EA|nr:hypothetical protein [Sphingomonas sp.]